jgi:hypothetical protein
MNTDTNTLKPLLDCTADDLMAMNRRLAEDCIDYLAFHGRSVQLLSLDSRCEHLLRLCADVDDSTVATSTCGVITICDGGFAGHFAPAEVIAQWREQAAFDAYRQQAAL